MGEEGESFEFQWSEDKMAGLKILREEDGKVSGSVVEELSISATEFVCGSDCRRCGAMNDSSIQTGRVLISTFLPSCFDPNKE